MFNYIINNNIKLYDTDIHISNVDYFIVVIIVDVRHTH